MQQISLSLFIMFVNLKIIGDFKRKILRFWYQTKTRAQFFFSVVSLSTFFWVQTQSLHQFFPLKTNDIFVFLIISHPVHRERHSICCRSDMMTTMKMKAHNRILHSNRVHQYLFDCRPHFHRNWPPLLSRISTIFIRINWYVHLFNSFHSLSHWKCYSFSYDNQLLAFFSAFFLNNTNTYASNYKCKRKFP